MRVVCKIISLRLLSSSLGNTVLLHMLFLEYETQIGKKNYQIAIHMHNLILTNLRKIEKRPKMRHRLVMHSAIHFITYNRLVNLTGGQRQANLNIQEGFT